jgi:hypothetical protein
MERSRLNGRDQEAPRTRIGWRDGPFMIECTGAGKGLRLRVYYGRHVMADEWVASVQAAWSRGSEICGELSAADTATYESGAGSG